MEESCPVAHCLGLESARYLDGPLVFRAAVVRQQLLRRVSQIPVSRHVSLSEAHAPVLTMTNQSWHQQTSSPG